MTVWQAIFLGIMQGISEFVPISSSGHLLLVPWLLNWPTPGLSFTIAVHLGTLLAILVYFHETWLSLLGSIPRYFKERDHGDPDFKLLLTLVAATVPGAIIGLLFEDQIERLFETPLFAIAMLSVTALLLFIGERLGKQKHRLGDITYLQGILIGVAQACAVVPGISRSGSTIAAAQAQNIERGDAARFSFLLSVPIILGPSIFIVLDIIQQGFAQQSAEVMIAGVIASAISSYLVIRWLLNYLRTRPTTIFTAYCLVASALFLMVYVVRG